MITLKRSDLIIPTTRQRTESDPQYIVQLATSIDESAVGLMHPPVIRLIDDKPHLVAGECRIKAFEQMWILNHCVRHAGVTYALEEFPATPITDLPDIDAFEAELEENIRRLDLTWQDRAVATSRLFELRTLQSTKHSTPAPSFESVARESGSDKATVRERVLVARHLSDPDVAKASSAKEALKIVKRKEELARSTELGERVGATFGAKDHSLLHGDCTRLLVGLASESFDVILTDPPYGIGAQDFGDAGGKAQGAHFYDDSYETWKVLINTFAYESYRVAKPQSHAYVFCDVDRFVELKGLMAMYGWKVFRTPIIWFNPSSQRAPWPLCGPQRKWQMILYAIKGDRNALTLQPDLITFSSDPNLNHQAQKPVELYSNLLRRTCRPGDSAVDPFCGTGTIFPAAHALKVKATGIELDPAAYGIAVERLARLK